MGRVFGSGGRIYISKILKGVRSGKVYIFYLEYFYIRSRVRRTHPYLDQQGPSDQSIN